MPLFKVAAATAQAFALQGYDEEHGYLTAEVGDVVNVLYVGEEGSEEGWLYCSMVVDAQSNGDAASERPRSGWVPKFVVRALPPPYPLKRIARDGRRYTKSEFLSHYGQENGERCWRAAGESSVWRDRLGLPASGSGPSGGNADGESAHEPRHAEQQHRG